MVDVRADDGASLATAESLITAAASNGHMVDEVMWTIGLARWLPEGDGDRARLMAGAGDLMANTVSAARAVPRSRAPNTE